MSDQIDPDTVPYKHLLGYFGAGILAAYRAEPDKYQIEGDSFHGRITLTNDYYERLTPETRAREFIAVPFGYRTLKSGDAAVVIVLPDLTEKSKGHVQRWSGFHLPNPEWTTQPDERFQMWARPNLAGIWNKGPGVRNRLSAVMHTINCLSSEAVGKTLFTHELSATLSFPSAENSHQYEDAHKELYRYLIDGLDRECIDAVAQRIGRPIIARERWTVMDLKKVFPNLVAPSQFAAAYDLVSNKRAPAAHKPRQPAVAMSASEQFAKDLELCEAGLKELLVTLEKELAMNGAKAVARFEAKKDLPKIVRPASWNYSICQADQMKGKTVERVEYGHREEYQEAHQSEVLRIHFTDGSTLSIDTHTNVGNLADDIPDLKCNALDVSFSLHWVPEK